MLFYGREFYEDRNVQVMNLAQKGAYMKLLWVCWQEHAIPADVEELAAICDHTPPDVFKRDFWPKLSRCFIPAGQAGCLINAKVEKVRQQTAEYREQQSRAGKAGAAKRWNQDGESWRTDGGTDGRRDEETDNDPNGERMASEFLLPNSKKEETNTCSTDVERGSVDSFALTPQSEKQPPAKSRSVDSLTGEQERWFAEAWESYWRRVSKKEARRAFGQMVNTAERFAEVAAAIKAQADEMLSRPPDKRPHFSTWLRGERWTDEPAETQQDAVGLALKKMYASMGREGEGS